MCAAKKLIDIGANLTDGMFFGMYHGSKKHESDLSAVLDRAWSNGLQKIIITAGNLEESKEAIKVSESSGRLFCTVGCHPTRCGEFESRFDPKEYLQELHNLAEKHRNKVIAIGECGLDYCRLHFCHKETQQRFFEEQLTLGESLHLPLFLHCRNAATDLIEILRRYNNRLYGGVVHSFDGSKEDAKSIMELGYHIGINGCSLKTEENLEVMASIPTDRLMIETDCPWCEIRPSHAGYKYIQTTYPTVKKEKCSSRAMVKGRTEPSHIIQVLEIMAAVRKEDIDVLSQSIYDNTERVFFNKN